MYNSTRWSHSPDVTIGPWEDLNAPHIHKTATIQSISLERRMSRCPRSHRHKRWYPQQKTLRYIMYELKFGQMPISYYWFEILNKICSKTWPSINIVVHILILMQQIFTSWTKIESFDEGRRASFPWPQLIWPQLDHVGRGNHPKWMSAQSLYQYDKVTLETW